MGLGSKVSELSHQMQEGVKVTLLSAATWAVKIVTAAVVGLTFALVGQEAFRYGNIALLLVMIVAGGLLLRWIKEWTLANVVVFDLICVLVGLSLKMYIMLAP